MTACGWPDCTRPAVDERLVGTEDEWIPVCSEHEFAPESEGPW